MAKYIDLGELPPDDPIYSTGFIIGGRRLGPPKKDSVMDEAIDQGSREVDKEMSRLLEDDD